MSIYSVFFLIPSKIYSHHLWICSSTPLFHFVMKSNAPVLSYDYNRYGQASLAWLRAWQLATA